MPYPHNRGGVLLDPAVVEIVAAPFRHGPFAIHVLLIQKGPFLSCGNHVCSLCECTLTHFHRCGLQAVGRCAERDLAGPGAPNEETGDAIVKVVRRNILEGTMPHRIGIAD